MVAEWLRVGVNVLSFFFGSNRGDHSPAYIYKLVNEAYDEVDADL